MKNNLIQTKSFHFACEVMKLYQALVKNNEFNISKQLIRSATSIGANINESSSAESLRDFISKRSIALKEAKESIYWLQLLQQTEIIVFNYSDLIKENEEIIRILSKSLLTMKNKLNPPPNNF